MVNKNPSLTIKYLPDKMEFTDERGNTRTYPSGTLGVVEMSCAQLEGYRGVTQMPKLLERDILILKRVLEKFTEEEARAFLHACRKAPNRDRYFAAKQCGLPLDGISPECEPRE